MIAAAAIGSASAQVTVPLFSPTDTVFGGISDGTNFLVGAVGTDGGNTNYTDNVWPAAESPDHIIDGVGQKYLNFAELNAGVVITPNLSPTLGTQLTSLKFWTANDAEVRDPATYSLFGTNAVLTPGGPFALSLFTPISSGALALPTTRNLGGTNPLQDANSQTVAISNTQAYKSYMILFPTVKTEVSANSMQIAEVQAFGVAVPEPSSAVRDVDIAA